LPDGEGSFWTHDTGGEHASKFIGYEKPYNVLCEQGLVRLDGEPTAFFTKKVLMTAMSTDDKEVIFVRHQSEESEFPDRLVAGAVGAYQLITSADMRLTVEELVVDQDFHNRR